MRLPLHIHDITENLKPLGNAERITSAALPPAADDPVSTPALAGSTSSGDRDSRQTHAKDPVGGPVNSQGIEVKEASFEEPAFAWGGLRGEELRARAADAIHSYLVYCTDYDLTHVAAALNRAMYMVDLIANALGRKARTGQDTP